jgi:hypothetical protein
MRYVHAFRVRFTRRSATKKIAAATFLSRRADLDGLKGTDAGLNGGGGLGRSRFVKAFSLFLVPLVLSFGSLEGAVTDGEVAVPPAERILATLNRDHPRLLMTAADLETLRQRVGVDPTLKGWKSKLSERGQRMLGEAPSEYDIPDGLRLLGVSRRVLDRVSTLALLYRLDGDERFAERAWAELDAAAGFEDWNPRHFLDTAEMTHALAIGYDWLHPYWSTDQRERLREAMVEKGLRPGVLSHRGGQSYGWWTRVRHNWNQVCNGGIGMGALALAEVEPELAGEFLEFAVKSIQLPMHEYAPDGAWGEGPGYWRYATSYNVVFLAALQSALGTDFGLSDIVGFREAGLFPIHVTGPLGRTFNYADGGDSTIRAPEMFWLARRYGMPAYAEYQVRVASPAPLDLVWFEPKLVGSAADTLPLARHFRGADVVTMRSAWDDKDATFVGFKGGDNKENHSHLDLGTFVFDALGVRWAMDLGADNYNLPGFFGNQRWTYYRLRAEGHNTLVINPGTGPDQDPEAAANIVRYESAPGRVMAIADLTAGYAAHAQSVKRGLAMLNRRQVLVQDEVEMKEPGAVWWFMHTPASIDVAAGGRAARLEKDGRQIVARLIEPDEARFSVMEARPLVSSPDPEGQNRNHGVRKLTVHLTEVRALRLIVMIEPVTTGERDGGRTTEVTSLDRW